MHTNTQHCGKHATKLIHLIHIEWSHSRKISFTYVSVFPLLPFSLSLTLSSALVQKNFSLRSTCVDEFFPHVIPFNSVYSHPSPVLSTSFHRDQFTLSLFPIGWQSICHEQNYLSIEGCFKTLSKIHANQMLWLWLATNQLLIGNS